MNKAELTADTMNGDSYSAFSLFPFKQHLTIISSTGLMPIKSKDYKHRAVRGSVIHVFNPSTLGPGVGRSELRPAWSTAFWDSQGYTEKTPSQKSKREGKKKKKQGQVWCHMPLISALEAEARQMEFKGQPGLHSEK